jgi:hypothetical protein
VSNNNLFAWRLQAHSAFSCRLFGCAFHAHTQIRDKSGIQSQKSIWLLCVCVLLFNAVARCSIRVLTVAVVVKTHTEETLGKSYARKLERIRMLSEKVPNSDQLLRDRVQGLIDYYDR